ncbi:insulinase family protein [Kitasatospora sp. GP82]|uniref:insulinase family protein n=1 Tax=Kitasatospora sp. GP82 TaxID=3035089 RepID=UPI0024771553|nr:insulinase family protein [Kitasatospora sp. GP82]MDH6125189.1 putative Zn-dependent peptidase [Kitasatospora sp. GP82]
MIHHFEVDGVPGVFAQRPGRLAAGLVFRVGQADEPLARAGITHLVEHLALHRSGVADHHFNGATGALYTHFHLEGTEQDVSSFLLSVCQSLTALPMERLETEKSILRTEESGRGPGPAEAFGVWRYGAQGHGLVSYPEWGVPGLDPQTVQQWADTWFTQGNAALWVSGEYLPAGLRLPLHPGRRMPVPAATSALPQTPAYFAEGQGQVLFNAVLPRSAATSLYALCLERELFRELRQEGGHSYTATAACAHRGDGWSVVTGLADALGEQQDAVLGGFVDVLARLAAVGIPQNELDTVRGRADEAYTSPEADAGRLPGYAADLLGGLPLRSAEELRAELWAVTPGEVHEAARQAQASGLLRVPAGRRADWAGYAAAPLGSESAVHGTGHSAREEGGPELVVGAEGVSLVCGDELATVRYRECAAMLSWPDGGRRLIGADGITVALEPEDFEVDAHTLATVDSAVPPQAVVRMPPRAPRPPRPSAPAPKPAAAPAEPAPVFGRGQRVLLAVFTVLAWLWGGITLLVLLTMDKQSVGDPAAWFVNAMLLAIEAGLVRAVLRRRRRRKAGRRAD